MSTFLRAAGATLVLLAAHVPPALALQAQDADLVDISGASRLQVTEQTRIGGYDDREMYALSFVPDAAVLPGGEIAVVDYLAKEVRIFGPDGVFRRRFGGPGQGPGEFGTLLNVVPISGDRLLLWDGAVPGSGVTIVTAGGDHLSTRRFEQQSDVGSITATMHGVPFPTPAWIVQSQTGGWGGAFPDGRLLLRQTRPTDMSPTRTDTARIVVYDPESRRWTVLGTAEGGESEYVTMANGIGSIRHKLFRRDFVTAVVNGEAVFGSTGEPLLHRRSPDGADLGVWRLNARARTASAADIRAERDSRIRDRERRSYPPEVMAEMRADIERTESHATLPEFRAILPGGDGALWVEDYPRPGARSVRWYRLESGVATGWFEIDASVDVQAIAHGFVVHTELDDLDVVTVVVSRLEGEPD